MNNIKIQCRIISHKIKIFEEINWYVKFRESCHFFEFTIICFESYSLVASSKAVSKLQKKQTDATVHAKYSASCVCMRLRFNLLEIHLLGNLEFLPYCCFTMEVHCLVAKDGSLGRFEHSALP